MSGVCKSENVLMEGKEEEAKFGFHPPEKLNILLDSQLDTARKLQEQAQWKEKQICDQQAAAENAITRIAESSSDTIILNIQVKSLTTQLEAQQTEKEQLLVVIKNLEKAKQQLSDQIRGNKSVDHLERELVQCKYRDRVMQTEIENYQEREASYKKFLVWTSTQLGYKLDLENKDLDMTLEGLANSLNANFVVLQKFYATAENVAQIIEGSSSKSPCNGNQANLSVEANNDLESQPSNQSNNESEICGGIADIGSNDLPENCQGNSLYQNLVDHSNAGLSSHSEKSALNNADNNPDKLSEKLVNQPETCHSINAKATANTELKKSFASVKLRKSIVVSVPKLVAKLQSKKRDGSHSEDLKRRNMVTGKNYCRCGLMFLTEEELKKHCNHSNQQKTFKCTECSKIFPRVTMLKRHTQLKH